jgi:hypothetical protein
LPCCPHPHCHHHCPNFARNSHCHRHCPRSCSPATLDAVTIALATVTIAVVIAANLVAIIIVLFAAFAFTRLPPLFPVAQPLGGGGWEDHPDPVRDPTLAAATSIAIVIAAIASTTFAIRVTIWKGPV